MDTKAEEQFKALQYILTLKEQGFLSVEEYNHRRIQIIDRLTLTTSSVDFSTPSSILSLSSRVSNLEQQIDCEGQSFPLELKPFPPLPNQLTKPPETAKRVSIINTTGNSLLSPTKPTAAPVDPNDESNYLPTLLSKFNELSTVWSKLEDDTMRQFFVRYALFEPELKRRLDLNTVELSLTMKQSILLSSYEELQQTAKLFGQLQQSTTVLDKQPIQNIEQFRSNINKHNELLQISTEQAAKLNDQIEQFVTIYNQLMDFISRKFVNWDSQLKKWESIVDKLAASKQKK